MCKLESDPFAANDFSGELQTGSAAAPDGLIRLLTQDTGGDEDTGMILYKGLDDTGKGALQNIGEKIRHDDMCSLLGGCYPIEYICL